MKTMFKILLGVYIGVLLKQRYRVPRVMTPEEMWDKVKEAERQQRIEPPEGGDEEESRRRHRRGWGHHGWNQNQSQNQGQNQGQRVNDAEQKQLEEQVKGMVERLKNLEQMYRQQPEMPVEPEAKA